MKPIVLERLDAAAAAGPVDEADERDRSSSASCSAQTIFCQIAASAAPPRTVKSSPWTIDAPAVDPALADDHVGGGKSVSSPSSP